MQTSGNIIKYTPISLTNQKITEDLGCSIQFFDDHILAKYHFYADEPVNVDDKDLGWEQRETNLTIYILKSSIAGFEICFLDKQRKWKVNAMIVGFGSDLSFYFKQQKDAEQLLEKFKQYIITNELV